MDKTHTAVLGLSQEVTSRRCGRSFSSWVSGVTRVGDTRGGKWGCHPFIFSWKTWRPFLAHHQLSLSVSLFVAFTRVSPPPSRVSPRTFFTRPTSFLHYS